MALCAPLPPGWQEVVAEGDTGPTVQFRRALQRSTYQPPAIVCIWPPWLLLLQLPRSSPKQGCMTPLSFTLNHVLTSKGISCHVSPAAGAGMQPQPPPQSDQAAAPNTRYGVVPQGRQQPRGAGQGGAPAGLLLP